MLKFTYTEDGISLELLNDSLLEWVSNRSAMAISAGFPLCILPSRACFLLPDDLELVSDLEIIISDEDREDIQIYRSNERYLEITIRGTWVVSEFDQEEGIFVTALGDRLEALIFQLWLETKIRIYTDCPHLT